MWIDENSTPGWRRRIPVLLIAACLSLHGVRSGGVELVAADQIAPEKSAGVPDETMLTASAVWARAISTDTQGRLKMLDPYPMQINLQLMGEGVEKICGFGLLTIKNGSVKGGKLKFVQPPADRDVTKNIFPFKWTKPGQQTDLDTHLLNAFKQPPGGLWVSARFDPPLKGQTKIDMLEGSFKVLTAEESEELTIEEPAKLARRPNDPILKKANLKLTTTKDEFGSDRFVIAVGKGTFLGKANLIIPVKNVLNGKSVIAAQRVIENNQPVYVLGSNTGKAIPDDARIEVTVHSGVKEKAITFRFADIPLPPPDEKPTEQELRREFFP